VNLTIKNRLMNFVRKMSTSKESINRNWIKMTNEKYISFRIEFASCSNSSLMTLSSSLSFVMRFTLSSSFVTRLKKKKNPKTTFVVFFFSIVLSSIKKKKSKINFCWFFFRLNLVIVLVNVIVYCLEIFVCVAIDFVMIFIKIKKYDYDVWNVFKKWRLFHYSFWRKFIDKINS
jgi:hypothetical protein